MTRIAIVGGHGQIARLLHPQLLRAGHTPVAVVPREEYRTGLERLGAEVRILDIERDDAPAFAAAFDGWEAVVFSAGGGPNGNKERKRTVDLEGSLKSMEGDVAAVIVAVLEDEAAVGGQWDLVSGDTPVKESARSATA